jgi:hypothetical protein
MNSLQIPGYLTKNLCELSGESAKNSIGELHLLYTNLFFICIEQGVIVSLEDLDEAMPLDEYPAVEKMAKDRAKKSVKDYLSTKTK